MDLKNISYVIFCSGMTRSASRWSYETCQELEKLRTPIEEISIGYVDEDASYVDANLVGIYHRRGTSIFHSHAFGKRSVRMILAGLAKNVYTYRDPRDSIASSMRITGSDIECVFSNIHTSLVLSNLFFSDGYSLLLPFSDVMDDPIGMTAKIAKYLDFDLAEDKILKIHMKTQKLAIERRNEQRRRTAHSPSDIEVIDRGFKIMNGEATTTPRIDNPWRYSALTENQYAEATKRLIPWLLKMNFPTSTVPPWKQD